MDKDGRPIDAYEFMRLLRDEKIELRIAKPEGYEEDLQERLRKILLDEDDGFPSENNDLASLWDRMPDEFRELFLVPLLSESFTRAEKWKPIRRLLRKPLEADEPIPDLLQKWACLVASGLLEEPRKPANRPKKAEQNLRIFLAFELLQDEARVCGEKFNQTLAYRKIAVALGIPQKGGTSGEQTIRSRIRKIEDRLQDLGANTYCDKVTTLLADLPDFPG